jgi:hypothetical protein
METEYIYGFKGFDNNLKCRGFQYEIGQSYHYEGGKDSISIGYRGFHYCNKLDEVKSYYSFNGRNRVCLVKAKYHQGCKYNGSDKSVTDEITILEEIPYEIIEKFQQYLRDISLDLDWNFRLEDIRKIQTAYPNFILGGSSALYLLGFNIKRNSVISDLDFITPYYTPVNVNHFKSEDGVTEADNMTDAKPSGNDFDYVEGLVIDGDFLILDMKIDPKQRFEIVNYDGFDYKVSPWYPIIEAKMRYASSSGGTKHKKDLIDMFKLERPDKIKFVNPIDSILNKYLV